MIEDELISRISKKCNRYGDKLLKFMYKYNLNSLREAKAEQLLEFIKNEAI